MHPPGAQTIAMFASPVTLKQQWSVTNGHSDSNGPTVLLWSNHSCSWHVGLTWFGCHCGILPQDVLEVCSQQLHQLDHVALVWPSEAQMDHDMFRCRKTTRCLWRLLTMRAMDPVAEHLSMTRHKVWFLSLWMFCSWMLMMILPISLDLQPIAIPTHSASVPAAGGWLLPHGEAGIAPSWQPWRPQDVVWGTTNPIGWCGTQNKADYVNHGFVGVDVFFCCVLFLWFWVSEFNLVRSSLKAWSCPEKTDECVHWFVYSSYVSSQRKSKHV